MYSIVQCYLICQTFKGENKNVSVKNMRKKKKKKCCVKNIEEEKTACNNVWDWVKVDSKENKKEHLKLEK